MENNDYLSPFIGDGYETRGTIPAVSGRWSEVTVSYRPFCADDESTIWAKSRLEPGEPMTKFYAEVMAAKIIDWDLKDRDGTKLPVTADNIRRLAPPFYDALKCLIDGSALPHEADTKNSSTG